MNTAQNHLASVQHAWSAMRQRCNNPQHEFYKDYGGRGIIVCERWNSFANFLADMGLKPSPRHSIDRINVNGNYEPGNCRWATPKEQATNRRNNRWVTAFGRTMISAEWSREVGIREDVLCARLTSGWPAEYALTVPASSGPRRKHLKSWIKEGFSPLFCPRIDRSLTQDAATA